LVARIAIEPGMPGTIYAVVRPSSGGVSVYRSSYAGTSNETWKSIVDGLQQSNPNLDPSCVAVDPVTPSRIYMGSWMDQSVYVSATRGDSWAPGVLLGARVRKLVIDPRTAGSPTSTTLYAATDAGVYRSSDSGSTWTNVLSGDVWSFCASMPMGGPDAYYAGVYQSGLYTTANPTGTWTNLNAAGIGLPAYSAMAPGNFSVAYADLCPLNPSRVYMVLLDGSGNFDSLYTSGSPTTAWSQATVSAPPSTAYGFVGFFGVYDWAFAVAPNSPGDGVSDILFFGGVGIFRSKDGGRNWAQPAQVLYNDHHEIQFYPAAPPAGTVPKLYLGCDGGLAVSDRFCDPAVDFSQPPPDNDELNTYTDTGEVQNYNHGIGSLATYAYASHPSFPALQYTACQDTGVAGGVKTLGWRGLAIGDATQIAMAPGSDGVKIWCELGQFGGWPEYRILMATDQGGYGTGTTTVTYAPTGSNVMATTQFSVTSGQKCLLGMLTRDADAAMTLRSTVGLIDQSADASRISQDFAPNLVTAVAVAPSGGDTGYCATSDGRLWATPSISAATSATVWTEIVINLPSWNWVSSITFDASGNAYALLIYPVVAGAITTPLFDVSGGAWIAQSFTGFPTGVVLGKIVADPVTAGVLYTFGGTRVYRLTLAGGTWTWADISDNLPAQPIYDMTVLNVAVGGASRVVLRVTIPTRGVWELDVANAGSAEPITLYVRDNFLDEGIFANSPDFTPSPYAPGDASQAAVHWACADIKVDAQQRPGDGNPDFFQTDPEGGTIPISPVAFDCLDDCSSSLPSTDAARAHVQVHNRSLAQANNVKVWAIYASAAGHVPSLAASPSHGNNFAFWSQFAVSGGVGTITPSLPADSPWRAIGPPITLQGIDAAHPQVATWNWTVPMLSSGDPGHYCIVCFVQSADNPITETIYDVDTVTPRNRGIGQRNLHIGPPLPASPGPKGGRAMREYIEFYNPYAEPAEFDLLFDFRSLPAALEVQLQFPEIKTVEPLAHAIVGIASRAAGDLIGQKIKRREGPGERVVQLPPLVHQVYTARPSSRVMVQRLMLAPFGKAAAFMSITNTGALPAGSRYRFMVRQSGTRLATGGSTYVVRIAGAAQGPKRFIAPSHDYQLYRKTGKIIPEADPTSLPPWIKYYAGRTGLLTR
jgi:hypothetical protein